MSERIVSLKTQRFQKPYGDTHLRAEVDFHLHTTEFGGAPAAEAAIGVVKLLWPTARNVDLTAEPSPDALVNVDGDDGRRSDLWIVRGSVTYSG